MHPARDRGQVHHVRTRPAHALHAGHVQQWNQGVDAAAICSGCVVFRRFDAAWIIDSRGHIGLQIRLFDELCKV